MSDPADVVRRYAQASAGDDYDTMDALRHPGWQIRLPQSGEAILSSADYRHFRSGRPEGAPRIEHVRDGGSADTWWGESIVHYGDGSAWLMLSVYELRDGLIHRERAYFGPPVEAPAWRREWVVLEEPVIR